MYNIVFDVLSWSQMEMCSRSFDSAWAKLGVELNQVDMELIGGSSSC